MLTSPVNVTIAAASGAGLKANTAASDNAARREPALPPLPPAQPGEAVIEPELPSNSALGHVNATAATVANRTILQEFSLNIAAMLRIARRPDENMTALFLRIIATIEAMPQAERLAFEARAGLKPLKITLADLSMALRNPDGREAARLTAMAEAPAAIPGRTAANAATTTYLEEGTSTGHTEETLAMRAAARNSAAGQSVFSAESKMRAEAPPVDAKVLQTQLKSLFEPGETPRAPVAAPKVQPAALPVAAMPDVAPDTDVPNARIEVASPASMPKPAALVVVLPEIVMPDEIAETAAFEPPPGVDTPDAMARALAPEAVAEAANSDVPSEAVATAITLDAAEPEAFETAVPADAEEPARPVPKQVPLETPRASPLPVSKNDIHENVKISSASLRLDQPTLDKIRIVAQTIASQSSEPVRTEPQNTVAGKADAGDRRLQTLLTFKGFAEAVTAIPAKAAELLAVVVAEAAAVLPNTAHAEDLLDRVASAGPHKRVDEAELPELADPADELAADAAPILPEATDVPDTGDMIAAARPQRNFGTIALPEFAVSADGFVAEPAAELATADKIVAKAQAQGGIAAVTYIEDEFEERIERQSAAARDDGVKSALADKPPLPRHDLAQHAVPFAYAQVQPAREEAVQPAPEEDRREQDENEDEEDGDRQGERRRPRDEYDAIHDEVAEDEPALVINRDSSEADRAFALYQRMGGF